MDQAPSGSSGSIKARSRPLILVASSNPSLWQRVKEALGERYAISYSVDLGGTLDVIQRHQPVLVILCTSLLDSTADEVVPHLKELTPDIPSLVITSSRGGRPAGMTLPLLADAYLDEHRVQDTLLAVVQSLIERADRREHDETMEPADPLEPELREYREMVIGDNPEVQAIVENARRVAPVDVTILITGESGTGKEVLARHIHRSSKRARGPFEAVDLPSVPDELFESILFGHERGSFTGAVAQNEGKFQRARRGTLFLDEISSLKLELQPKLLRAIQEKKVECVGGREPIPCDVRIIAATNVDLEQAVRRGEFRSDLFYRLSVIRLDLVPLRCRREDIPTLLDFFIDRYSREYSRDIPEVSSGAQQALKDHDWPGNIRELENRVQRALLLCRSKRLAAEDFFDARSDRTPAQKPEIQFGSCDHSIAEIEQMYINQVMERTSGNQSRAAQILQISRKTLRNKLQVYSTDKPCLRSVPTGQAS